MTTTITALPSAPNRATASDPNDYSNAADAWAAALDTWTSEVNTVGSEVETSANNASTSASNASTSESNASVSATLSSEWATTTNALVDATDYSAKEYAIGTTVPAGSAKAWADASEGFKDDAEAAASSASADWTGTSTTSVTIGLGAKSFVIETGKSFVIGQSIRISYNASPEDTYMTGIVVGYNDVSGLLDADITGISGSGSFSDWSVVLYTESISNKYSYLDNASVNSTFDFDISSYGVFNLTVDGDTTFTASGLSDTASFQSIIRLKDAGSYSVTMPSEFILSTDIDSFSSSWNLPGASYTENVFSVSSQSTNSRSIAISEDKTKLYYLASTAVYQYTMSTPGDISTSSYDSIVDFVNSQDTSMVGIYFKDDGSKMFLVGDTNNSVYQYTLSTPWDLSTSSYDSVSYSVASQLTNPADIAFGSNGSKMYILSRFPSDVYQYTLSTPWDLSTSSYDSVSYSVASNARGIFFNNTGSIMYELDIGIPGVRVHNLSVNWNLSTATSSSIIFDITGQASGAQNISFSSDGTGFYIIDGNSPQNIFQYSMPSSDLLLATQMDNSIYVTRLGVFL